MLRLGRHSIPIPVLFENRSILALDKPSGWILGHSSVQSSQRNLQTALQNAIAAGANWALQRRLGFLRFLHRLDAETTGILLMAKSRGAIASYSKLFASRNVQKAYWAITEGMPSEPSWTCRRPLAPDPTRRGSMIVATHRKGLDALTHFTVLATQNDPHAPKTLIEARPVTGRTHQIRVHLAAAGLPVCGDPLYTTPRTAPLATSWLHPTFPMGLRATWVAFRDPFERSQVTIQAPVDDFLRAFGFPPSLATKLPGRMSASA